MPDKEARKIEEAAAKAQAAAAKLEVLDLAQEVWTDLAGAAVAQSKAGLTAQAGEVPVVVVEAEEEEDDGEDESEVGHVNGVAEDTSDATAKKVIKKKKKRASTPIKKASGSTSGKETPKSGKETPKSGKETPKASGSKLKPKAKGGAKPAVASRSDPVDISDDAASMPARADVSTGEPAPAADAASS